MVALALKSMGIAMNRPVAEEAEWDDDVWDEDDESTIPCPYCRREIFEDSPQCPHCGQYISKEDAPAGRRPWWIIVGVLLCLMVMWLWITR